MGIEELTATTPVISEAIAHNDIPSLHEALVGLFNYRAELLRADALEDQGEIAFVEELIGRISVYLAEWNGINSVGAKLLLRGIIESRGDVLRLAAPIYDWMDKEKFQRKSVPMIGFVGPIAGGKGTAGKIVTEIYNAMHLPLSDRLREYATAQSLPPHSRDKLREVNDDLKPRFGNSVFVRWTMAMAERLAGIYDKAIMSMDGFRSLDEANLFKEQGGVLIAVTASPDVRYQRVLSRKREADDFGRDDFERSDAIEREWIDPIIGIADIEISNEGTLEELEFAIRQYLNDLKI